MLDRKTMNRTTLALTGLALLGSLLAAPARAQTFGRTVLIPHTVSEPAAVLRVVDPVEAALVGRRVPVISLHDARDRFVTRSRAPSASSDTDVDVLAREAHAALEHVALGRSAAAERSVREVLNRAELVLDSLNRQTSTARQVLDACLALVRTALAHDDRREAVQQAIGCRRLVPDVAPNEGAHPANVIGVLAEADDQLRRMRIGRLSVQSAPQSGCSVYLNGRHLGTTPFLLERAAAGEYRVQVECGDARGRVHVVELGDEPVDVVVDSAFDRAIESEPRLFLRYVAMEQEREQIQHHAELAGRAIRADDVVLVGLLGDHVELIRVAVRQGRIIGRTKLPWDAARGYDRAELARALDMLAEGRVEGEPSAVVAVAEMRAPIATHDSAELAELRTDAGNTRSTLQRPADPASTEARDLPHVWAGATLVAAGTALYALGLGYEIRAQQLDDDIAALAFGDPALKRKADAYDRASALRWLGVGGGVLGTAAVPMLTKARPSVPWWGWSAGVAGLGLIGVGAWQVAIADRCELEGDGGSCLSRNDSDARGALLMSAAAPLIALPITQLLERAGVEHASTSLTLRPGRFVASLVVAH